MSREKVISPLQHIRGMAMRRLTPEEAREVAREHGLIPARVRGTRVVQLVKRMSDKFEPISWEEFFAILEEKELAVYVSKSGYVKIMDRYAQEGWGF